MRLGVAVAVACLSVIGLSVADDVKASIRKPTNIPAEALGPALQTLAKERGFQIAYISDEVDSRRTQGAVGDLTTNEALMQLLSGTGLTYRYFGDRAVSIIPIGSVDASGGASTQAQVEGSGGASSSDKEGKKTSSDGFRVAQVDQGKTSGVTTVESNEKEQSTTKKRVQLEEVVVTGSRIPSSGTEGAQRVEIFDRQQIEQSGQTTIGSFLSTLPSVSVAITENGIQTNEGGTTIQLHGLPIGTTLVLLNGRRLEQSGASQQGAGTPFFDLNNVPISAVDRIEVVPEGSSAVYGADAVAGVVNIILRKDFDGFEANAKYGGASKTNETDANLAWGKHWSDGSLSIMGTFQNRRELEGFDRKLTSSDDYRPYGGSDMRSTECNPGNVFSTDGSNLPGIGAPYAAVPAGFTGVPTQSEFATTAGTLNKCTLDGYYSLLPATRRASVMAQGDYKLTATVQLFTELLYSHLDEYVAAPPSGLYGQVGFQQYTASASNPFNPFGETVGVSDLFTSLGRFGLPLYTNYTRTLVGAKGDLPDSWKWEVAGWYSEDRSNNTYTNVLDSTAVQNALNSANPSTALNPFVPGPPGSAALLHSLVFDLVSRFNSELAAFNGFVHGPLLQLPQGAVEFVIGGEYIYNKSYTDIVNSPTFPPNTQTTFTRDSYSSFAEARIPILANPKNVPSHDRLVLTLAGRFDHYNDFGSKTTPQIGVEWRPMESLLIRGGYAEAFVAPSLSNLHQAAQTFSGQVVDPRTGMSETVIETFGGNPDLKSETGKSRSLGFLYSSTRIPGLKVSVTDWRINEANSIQSLGAQTIVDNENLFPGNVIRNPGGTITQVNATFVNFGQIKVEGLDYQLSYLRQTALGEFTLSLAATETYRYESALQPRLPPTDRVSKANDDGNWAPRWKSVMALGWKFGPWSTHVDGRYVGKYQDYDSTNEIGKFWLLDANLRYAVGEAFAANRQWLKGTYVEIGGVNILDRLPQYSNYDFGFTGYDPTQADLRGRFLYGGLGLRW